MGLFDLFRRPQSLLTAAAVATSAPVVPSKPLGISGGGNYMGQIQTAEPNALLREQAGFGRAGTQTIGEWADLALTNPYVTAGLDFILAPISDVRIDIEADDSTPLSQQQIAFLTWALTERFRLNAHNTSAARGFLVSGFALFEPRAALVPCPVLGRTAFALASLEQRLPNSLSPNAWREDADGRLVAIQQQGPKGGTASWTTVMLPASSVLLYSWKREGNNWAGSSQLRSVWYLAGRIMPMLLKLVGVTAQREGAGLPVVFMKDGAAGDLTPEQRAELMTFIAHVSFHESGGIILPVGVDVRWEFSPGADKGFILDLWHRLGQAVLLQLGAQQLTLGMGDTGSRSVGEVHDAKAAAFVRAVLVFQESVLNGDKGEAHEGLVARLLAWNGLLSPDGAMPRVKLTPRRPELPAKDLAEAAASLRASGLLTVTIDDENSMRERLGLPPIDEETRTEMSASSASTALNGAQVTAATDLMQRVADELMSTLKTFAPTAKEPPPAFGGPPLMPVEPNDDKAEPLKASAQRAAWKPWRALRASEQAVPFAEINAYFDERKDTFEQRMRPLVVLMLSKAAPALDAAMADGIISPQEIAGVPLAMGPLKKALRKYVTETRTAGAAFLRQELGSKLKAAAAVDDVTTRADKVLEAVEDGLATRMENRLRSELAREAIDVLRTGGDATEVWTRAVARQIESGAFRSDAGSVTTKAFSVGRDEAARIMGGIASVEVSAILDSNTCTACEALDGETAEFDSLEHDRLLPPMRDCSGGDNCRCLLVMIPGRDGGDS